VDLSTILI